MQGNNFDLRDDGIKRLAKLLFKNRREIHELEVAAIKHYNDNPGDEEAITMAWLNAVLGKLWQEGFTVTRQDGTENLLKFTNPGNQLRVIK